MKHYNSRQLVRSDWRTGNWVESLNRCYIFQTVNL